MIKVEGASKLRTSISRTSSRLLFGESDTELCVTVFSIDASARDIVGDLDQELMRLEQEDVKHRRDQQYARDGGGNAVKQAFKALIGRKFIDPTIENRGEVPAKEQQVQNIWFDNQDYFQILVQYWDTTEEKPQVSDMEVMGLRELLDTPGLEWMPVVVPSPPPMSEYQQHRLQRIAANDEFLRELGLI